MSNASTMPTAKQQTLQLLYSGKTSSALRSRNHQPRTSSMTELDFDGLSKSMAAAQLSAAHKQPQSKTNKPKRAALHTIG